MTGLVTMGTGTFGLGSWGRTEEVAFTDPPPIDTSTVLFRARVWWDGDGSPATTYTDQPLSQLTGEDARVMSWGEVVRQAKGVASFDRWGFTLSNVPDPSSGARVSDEWGPGDPPEGKLVALEYRLEGVVPAWMLGEWRELFVGRVIEVPLITGTQVQIVASTDVDLLNGDVLPVVTVDDWPEAPEDSLGRHVPLVLGLVPRVEGVLVQEPPKAVLATDITAVQTVGIEFKVDPGFPSSGSLLIGAEVVTYSGIDTSGDTNTLTGVARGTGGTTAVPHLAGSILQKPTGSMAWAFSMATAVQVDDLALIDDAGNLRAVPDDVGVAVDLGPPAVVTLDKQPILDNLAGTGAASFLFVDLDQVDTSEPNTSPGLSAADVGKMCGLADEFTETNYVTLSATAVTRRAATAYRSTDVLCFPEGASLVAAYAVVEHYEVGGSSTHVVTALNGAVVAADVGDILVDSVAGLDTGALGVARAYIGEELVKYTGVTDIPSPRLQGVTRGHNAVGALDHPDGTAVVQSALEVQLHLDDAGANTVAEVDGEGYVQVKPTAPVAVQECSGLGVQSKGFEDAHTHVIQSDHTHTTDTAHTHDSLVMVPWRPSQVAAREVLGLPGTSCSPTTDPGWSDLFELAGDYGDAVDGNASTNVTFGYNAPLNFGHYYLIGTAADLSPNDTRPVKRVEAVVVTSWSPLESPGLVTLTWADTGGGLCGVVENTSTSTVGVPRLNIHSGNINVDNTGNQLSMPLALSHPPADYDANPNSIFTESFELDVSALGLIVGDFVDKNHGGVTNRSAWVHWQANGLEVHSVSFRLFVDETTGETELDPIDPTAWPDTAEGGALSVSTLSWFDLSPKVQTPADLVGARLRVLHPQRTPYLSDMLVLRAFLVLEVSGGVLGGEQAPRRLVARVDSSVGAGGGGLAAGKASTYMADLFRSADLLDDASLVTVGEFAAVQASVINGSGVQYDQVTYADLLQTLADGARLTPRWLSDGTLGVSYRASSSALAVTSPSATFRRGDMLPTAGGPSVRRAPLSQLVTSVTVLAGVDPVADGPALTASAVSASAVAAYGTSRSVELEAPFVSTQAAADDLAAHVLDYNAALPQRVSWPGHFGAKALAVQAGDLVAVVTPEVSSGLLVVERMVITPGRAVSGQAPTVSIEAVERAP